MVFFQAELLLGYGVAHLGARRLGRRQVPVHLAVVALPLLVLPLAVPAGWALPDGTAPALWTLLVLGVVVGLPFLALSTASPTFQRWFSMTGHRHADDPYFLYAAGNVGSLLALLAYPLVLEPHLSTSAQSRLWSIGYVAFVALTAGCAVVLRRRQRFVSPIASVEAPTSAPLTNGLRCAADRLRLRPQPPDARRHPPPEHRHRLDPAPVGRAAQPLPAQLRAGVRAIDHPTDRPLRAGRRPPGRPAGCVVRRLVGLGLAGRPPPPGPVPGRCGAGPRPSGGAPAARRPPDRVLPVDLAGWRPRRHRRGARGPRRLHVDPRVPAGPRPRRRPAAGHERRGPPSGCPSGRRRHAAGRRSGPGLRGHAGTPSIRLPPAFRC